MSRTRTINFLDGLAFSYIFQFVVMVTGIWLTPFLLRHLGLHDYGLWLVGLQLLNYLGLVDFGILAVLPREVAYIRGRTNDSAELAGLVGKVGKVVSAQTLLVALASYILWRRVPSDWMALRTALGWMLAATTAIYPLKLFPAVLEGLQDIGFANRVRLVSWLASTGITVWMVEGGWGLNSLAAGLVINQAVFSAITALRLKARHPAVFQNLFGRERLQWRDFTRGAWVSLGQVAQLLLSGIDMLVIGKVLGPAAVVPYACTAKLIAVMQNQPHMIVHAALPGLSELKTSESPARILSASTALNLSMLLLSGFLGTVVLCANEGFTRWWVGDAQYAGNLLSLAFVVTMVVRHFTHTLGYTLFCFGYEKLTTISALIEGAFNLVAAYLLVRAFGLVGIPIATTAAALLVSLPLGLKGLCQELKVSPRHILQPFAPLIVRSTALLALGYGFTLICMPRGPLWLAVTCLVAAIVYATVMSSFLRRPPLSKYIQAHVPALRSWSLYPANAESATAVQGSEA
jgi:O-antigen/teichoic acid export membrane protein